MNESTDPIEVLDAPRADLYTTLLRMVAGGVGEGIDRLLKVSAELDDADIAPDGELVGPFRADPTVMAVVGWMSELPSTVRGIGASAYRSAYPMTRLTGVAIDTTMHLARLTGVSALLDDMTEPLRTAIADERERLAAVGTAEYARGRVLAVYAFEQSVEGMVALLSESEELGELVREQTLGVTGAAINEIRETGAAADRLTEGLFRRLRRRPERSLPPMPAAASGTGDGGAAR
jgi:hypothetical protein